jgi:hypothetical protein
MITFPLGAVHGKIGFEGDSGRGTSILIHLHSQATTTPKVRAAIQGSDELATVLAERFGVTLQTIYKWRKRDSVEDRSHRPTGCRRR